jgi:hypothetical protein
VKKKRDILFPTGMQTYSMGISLMHLTGSYVTVFEVMMINATNSSMCPNLMTYQGYNGCLVIS